MTVTATIQQIADAFIAWDYMATEHPEEFAEWDEKIGDDAVGVAQFFVSRLIEQGATVVDDLVGASGD
jgi:hypothetical protein